MNRANLLPTQGQVNVQLSKVQNFANAMLRGDTFPAIAVRANRIVDGCHRYLAGLLTGLMPKIDNYPGYTGLTTPWSTVDIVP